MSEQAEMIPAGIAMVKVLEAWGVDHLYGIPGGSFNSTMDALLAEKDNIQYIQVRHEEVGAMAAAADAKLTGKIGVAFGSAGPGGTHLLNGLYDAREDHVPVLALIGQFGTSGMNMDTFQEMNENPIYADVSVYNVTAVTAQSLPHLIDEAIRRAYAQHGVAVVQIPVDLPWQDIPAESWYASANSYQQPLLPQPDPDKVKQIATLLEQAERPVIYFGIGTRGAGQTLQDISNKFKIPLISTYPAKAIVPDDFPLYLGSTLRVAQKPGTEALANADTVLFVGSNFPFAEVASSFKNTKHFMQIDIDPAKLGKRHKADVALLADAKVALAALLDVLPERAETGWYKANAQNVVNWRAYLSKLETKTEGDLQLYQVYNQINRVKTDDAIFSLDVGDVNQTSNRHLHLTDTNRHFTSNLFATMGVGIPGAIAARLNNADKQVWSLSGDGGAAMVMQDLVTQVQYKLPVINVVFSNNQFGFIKDEQEDTNKGYIGVEFNDIDFSKVAEAVGMQGFLVTKISELADVFDQAVALGKTEPVLIDARISGDRPIPTEALQLDPTTNTPEQIAAFKARFEAEDLQPLRDFLVANDVVVGDANVENGGF
ncbi:pyruvate oxidase [Weissella cibaria]|uniref:pyruvate oxidase n=1 Tax=Weissella cibaria TaxID=137591 RepID=UPI0031B59517